MKRLFVILAGLALAATAVFAEATSAEKTVFDSYLKIQASLAADSLKDVATAAAVIAKAVQTDADKKLPAAVAKQAEELGKAADISAARAAFKELSRSLIAYRKANKSVAQQYHVAYCPMADASWLQTNKTIANPYFGSSMLHCGEIKD